MLHTPRSTPLVVIFWTLAGNYVAHWSWMRCAAALGIIPGETYREPQASSGKRQAASSKHQAWQLNLNSIGPSYTNRKVKMSTKDNLKIVGGLAKPSKMPGWAYGLPAAECKTGGKLKHIPGSTCEGCYADKGCYVFPVVQAAQYRRLEAIRHPQWVNAMACLLYTSPSPRD